MNLSWNELYSREHEPSQAQVKEHIKTSLFDDLDSYLRQSCNVRPKLAYSGCSMDQGIWKGWNVKYNKRGKALCTLYPKHGYLLLLIPIGTREMKEAQLLMPLCTQYTQELFRRSGSSDRKSLGFEVRDENVLRDVISLIGIRTKTK